MFNKILLPLFAIVALSACSVNPVSTERVSAFNLIDYNTFSVQISESSEEVRVSPFTSAGLRNQLSEELLNLGMSISDDPDLVFTLSIGFDERDRRRSTGYYYRKGYYGPFYDPFWNSFEDDDRSFLRVTVSDASGNPLWTGIRSTRYVRSQLVLSPEEVNSYIMSFVDELTG